MTDLDDFLNEVLPRQIKAEEAIHNGDPEPRLRMWSSAEPVTLLGAFGPCKSGWDEVSQTFRWVAARFSNGADYSFELLAAGVSGDLAYTVGLERRAVSLDGGPVTWGARRVTHVYRRELGDWKIVHRHGDSVGVDQSRPTEASSHE